MRVVTYHSHLNGLEFLHVHQPALWAEIIEVIKGVDAGACLAKVSSEVRTLGHTLYSPIAMNAAMNAAFRALGWAEPRTSYEVTDEWRVIRPTMNVLAAQQDAEIAGAGCSTILSDNQTELVKDRVAVEVHLGKSALVGYDLFAKHLAFYVGDIIDVGIEILPTKELQAVMSSGVAFYEGELNNLIREGRGVPAVPLVVVGVAP